MKLHKILLSLVIVFSSGSILAGRKWDAFTAGAKRVFRGTKGRASVQAVVDAPPVKDALDKPHAKETFRKSVVAPAPLVGDETGASSLYRAGAGVALGAASGDTKESKGTLAPPRRLPPLAGPVYKSVQMGNVNETSVERAARYRSNAALLRADAQVPKDSALARSNEARAKQYDGFAAKEDRAIRASEALAAPL